MRNLHIKVEALLLILIIFSHYGLSQEAFFEKVHVDLGQIDEGKSINWETWLKNPVKNRISPFEIKFSCHCTTAVLNNNFVDPGGSVMMSGVLKVPQQPGYLEAVVEVTWKLGDNFGKTQVYITGKVQLLADIAPRSIDFGSVNSDRLQTKKIEVVRGDSKISWQYIKVWSDDFEISKITQDKGKFWFNVTTPTGKQTLGPIRGLVFVQLQDSKNKPVFTYELKAYGAYSGDLFSEPSLAYLGKVGMTSGWKTIRILSKSKKVVEIQNVSSENSNFVETRIARDEFGPVIQFRLNSKGKAGKLSSMILVQAKSDGEYELGIPVLALIDNNISE